MTDLEQIRNLVNLQNFNNRKLEIHQKYAEQEQRLIKLASDNESFQATADDIAVNVREMEKKINNQIDKREEINKRINSLEEGKDKLKVARQVKSWEKDMERMQQELSLIQAQIDYDTSKRQEMQGEHERILGKITENSEKIKELEEEIRSIKEEFKDELESIDLKVAEIRKLFDTTFIDYFQKMLSKTKGHAIVEVEEDACSGCNIVLPTVLQGDLGPELSHDDITLLQCPHCFRYLFYSEWLDDETSDTEEEFEEAVE